MQYCGFSFRLFPLYYSSIIMLYIQEFLKMKQNPKNVKTVFLF